MILTNSAMSKAIDEINAITFDRPSKWLEVLKKSAISAVNKNDCSLIDDDSTYCEMTESEYEEFITARKEEAYYHDQWDEDDLQRRIVRRSKECVDAWNEIIEILILNGVDKVNKKWFMKPTDASELISKFCDYTLPDDAVVGGEWNLPEWYIGGVDDPSAPYWQFEFVGFIGYIRSVKKPDVTETDDPNILKVEYWIYRCNSAHCDGYYSRWSTGTAMVNISSHRRWNVG